eukprot:jgi/Orpsp1_1/1192301/evm.model.d7180000092096.1
MNEHIHKRRRKNNYEIELYLNAIDYKNINKFKYLLNQNEEKNIIKDILLELYEKDLLTYERLQFIIENNNNLIYISSSLITKLIKNKNYKILNIIFKNIKIFDKSKVELSDEDLNTLIWNEKYIISKNNDNYYLYNFCIRYNNENMIKFLIEHGADVNEENHNGETALFIACLSGNEDLVKYLVEHGANINKKNKYGKTPLSRACFSENKNIIKYLIKHGADINKKNCLGKTPLYELYLNKNENFIKYFKYICQINKENYYGETPFFKACLSGNENIVKYLVEKGVYINKINNKGETPLFNACLSGNENIVKYLVEKRVDIDKENYNGETPFFKACLSGNENI